MGNLQNVLDQIDEARKRRNDEVLNSSDNRKKKLTFRVGHLVKALLEYKRFDGYSGIDIGVLDKSKGFQMIDSSEHVFKVLADLTDDSFLLYVRRSRKTH